MSKYVSGDNETEDVMQGAPSNASKPAIPVLKLTRTSETVTSIDNGKSYQGRRGILELKGSVFHTVERMGGYVHLKPGSYQCWIGNRASNGKPCVHIAHDVRRADGKRAGIVMHVANYPHEIKGCIAPGMRKISGGVAPSGEALKKIFQLMAGGFKKGAEGILEVAGDMYRK